MRCLRLPSPKDAIALSACSSAALQLPAVTGASAGGRTTNVSSALSTASLSGFGNTQMDACRGNPIVSTSDAMRPTISASTSSDSSAAIFSQTLALSPSLSNQRDASGTWSPAAVMGTGAPDASTSDTLGSSP